MSLDALLKASASQLKAMFKTVEPVRSSVVTLAPGRVGKLVYAFKQVIPGHASLTVNIVQFLIVKGISAYVVSFATTASLTSRDKIFTSIVNTFEVLD